MRTTPVEKTRRLPLAVTIALLCGIAAGPLIQSVGMGGATLLPLYFVAISVLTTLVTDRLHFVVSGLFTVVTITSIVAVGAMGYSHHERDPNIFVQRVLTVYLTMLITSLLIGGVITCFVLWVRRR